MNKTSDQQTLYFTHRGCEVHSTVILSPVDEKIFKKLGMHLTCEPKYETDKKFHA